jgi:hypothetical protein
VTLPHRSNRSPSRIGPRLRLLWAAGLAGPALPVLPVDAGIVESPACRRDLAEADALVHAIRLRENSVSRGDWSGLCRLLRQNLQDMSRARLLMNPCLTGHDHGENIAQMDASIGDIRYVLDTRCR